MLERFIGFFFLLLPFQFALNPTTGVDLAVARIFALVIFFWWLASGLSRQSISLPPLFFTGSVFSFLLLAVASILWAENIEFASRKLLFLLNFFPLLFVFYDLIQEKKNVNVWLHSLLYGAAAAALIGLGIFLSQFFFGVAEVFSWLSQSILPIFLGQNLGTAVGQYPSLLVNVGGETMLRATAFFPDPHVASFYFGMTGFLALGLFLDKKRKLFLVMAVVLFLADLLTFSRGGYFGLAAGGLLFLILSWNHTGVKLKGKTGIFLGMTILLFFFFGQGIFSRLVSSFTLSDSSSTERIVLWQTAIENIQERLFLGTGLGNYILAVSLTADYRTPYYAHNLYLDIAAELGLVGLFFFLIVIALSYIHALKEKGKNIFFLRIAAVSALTLYLTHSFFETTLYSIHILTLLLFFIIFPYHTNRTYEEPSSPK